MATRNETYAFEIALPEGKTFKSIQYPIYDAMIKACQSKCRELHAYPDDVTIYTSENGATFAKCPEHGETSVQLKNYRRMVLEAGEDEADKEAEEEQPTDSEELGDDADSQKAVEEVDVPFSGLDLRSARCFGYAYPQQNGWLYIAHQADDMGWKHVDTKALEKSLTKDVEKSYKSIAQYKLVNVDDDMAYLLSFDNNKELWDVEILDSPKAEMTTEERGNFFKSDMFKKISKKTYNRLLDAKETYDSIVKPHLDNGELLLVDTVKLDAIMHFINLDHFMDNLLNGKYLSY